MAQYFGVEEKKALNQILGVYLNPISNNFGYYLGPFSKLHFFWDDYLSLQASDYAISTVHSQLEIWH